MKKTEGLDLTDLLERGQRATERLGPATDELTEILAQIERTLAARKLGIERRVVLEEGRVEDTDDGPLYTPTTFLAFRKDGKTWRFMIQRGIDNDPDSWSSAPLINASREDRLMSVDHLPDLIEALVRGAEEEIAKVETKRSAAKGILEILKRSSGSHA
ncbi:MAG: hypothetical protein LCH36_13955 [Actinobacteria bacterium]|nr:hypothetical protein [Actinomycetota bacterium]